MSIDNFNYLNTSREAHFWRASLLWRTDEGYLAPAQWRWLLGDQHVDNSCVGPSMSSLTPFACQSQCIVLQCTMQTDNNWCIQTGQMNIIVKAQKRRKNRCTVIVVFLCYTLSNWNRHLRLGNTISIVTISTTMVAAIFYHITCAFLSYYALGGACLGSPQ